MELNILLTQQSEELKEDGEGRAAAGPALLHTEEGAGR